ncbi:MAG: DUF1269 domain-containing protein [Pyrinomonadaceae bacterium]
MAKLIVIGFKDDKFKASEVLSKLREMDREWTVQLNDAAAVYRDANGELRVDQKHELTPDEGVSRGLMWGIVVGGLLAIPIAVVSGGVAAAAALTVGTAGGAGAGAVVGALTYDWRKEGFGLSEEFIGDVGSMIQPGDSAIFAVLDVDEPDEVINRFNGTGGKVLMTSLSDEQKAKIEEALNGAQS